MNCSAIYRVVLLYLQPILTKKNPACRAHGLRQIETSEFVLSKLWKQISAPAQSAALGQGVWVQEPAALLASKQLLELGYLQGC